MCNHAACLCIHFISCRTDSGDVLMSIIAIIIAIIVALGVGACGDFFVLALFSINKDEREECNYRGARCAQRDESEESMQRIQEKCICCGRTTDYYLDTPSADRKLYVSGCGQLCKNCYTALNMK